MVKIIVENITHKTQRLLWVDWMKCLAIFLIIAGHCHVPGNKYIYVFSVPCFFIISGFLSKHESNVNIFWNKLFWNLIIPMFLWVFITMIYHTIGQFFSGKFVWSSLFLTPLRALCGFASEGLWRMWFVYTLVICKIILQFTSVKYERVVLPLLCLFFLILCVWLRSIGYREANAIVNVLLSLPFFVLGYFFKPYKQKLSELTFRFLIFGGLTSVLIVFVCGQYNDIVMLYRCSFGNNIVFCMIGGIAGTIVVFAISKLLSYYFGDLGRVLGGGTLVVLAVHYDIMKIVSRFLEITGYWLYIESFIILLFCYPIILFVKNNLPILYGKNRV